MGNCNVTGGNLVGCSLLGGTGAVLVPRPSPTTRVHIVAGDSGRVMELDAPVRAGEVVAGHPRHGVFRVDDLSSPLPHHEQLHSGRVYYLLLLDQKRATRKPHPMKEGTSKVDLCSVLNLEVLTPPKKGVWRIKLVIRAEHLATILAEQSNTEALIERLRILASKSEAMVTPQGKQLGVTARKVPPGLLTLSPANDTCERF